MVKVIVQKKWGNYKKGDTIEMNESTAKAVAKHGVVKLEGQESPKPVAKEPVKDNK